MTERRRWIKIDGEQEKTSVPRIRREVKLSVEQPRTFEAAIQKYKEAWDANTLTPELVNRTWQLFWRDSEKAAGLDRELEVPVCDRTTKELAALRAANRGIILLPQEVMSLKTLLSLIPAAGKESVLRSTITNTTDDRGGCVDVEMDRDAPNRNWDAKSLRRLFEYQGRKGQRLASYLVASHFNKLLTGHYFDEDKKAWVALLGSKGSAYLRVNAQIFTNPKWAASQSQWRVPTGGRSEGRK